MTTPQQWDTLIGLTAVDADGEKIGKIGQVYLDDDTGQPAWVTVSTGMLGTGQSFAPLYNASVRDGELVLAVPRQLVKDAPDVAADGHLQEAEVTALYEHYAAQLGAGASPGTDGAGEDGYTGRHSDEGDASAAGYDTQVSDDAMTRSEERLHIGTESVPAGRARLRKYVVTENVTTTVPVSHEEVRLEREPITDANRDAALSGADISGEEHEVTLQAERPVVAKETVPVERVRLATETVTEERQIEEEVRKERIDEPDVDITPQDPQAPQDR
jgi:uncharacterized protein (TIGR02271 family)